MTVTQTDWKRPPVIEVVLGIQFAPIAGLTNGHLGWFWRSVEATYPRASDSAPIQPVLESFEEEPEFGYHSIGFAQARGDSRLRMASVDGSRMLQAQNGWLVSNWVKRTEGPYPGYTGVLEQFQDGLGAFVGFLKERGLGELAPNLWEVTYIDHIPRGTVWGDFEDLCKVVPGLLGASRSRYWRFQALGGTWGFQLKERPARLAVTLQTARSTTDPPNDLLVVRSTARGRLDTLEALSESLNFGRAAVVGTFMDFTSNDAQSYWKG